MLLLYSFFFVLEIAYTGLTQIMLAGTVGLVGGIIVDKMISNRN